MMTLDPSSSPSVGRGEEPHSAVLLCQRDTNENCGACSVVLPVSVTSHTHLCPCVHVHACGHGESGPPAQGSESLWSRWPLGQHLCGSLPSPQCPRSCQHGKSRAWPACLVAPAILSPFAEVGWVSEAPGPDCTFGVCSPGMFSGRACLCDSRAMVLRGGEATAAKGPSQAGKCSLCTCGCWPWDSFLLSSQTNSSDVTHLRVILVKCLNLLGLNLVWKTGTMCLF